MRIILINPPHPYLKQPYAQAPLGLMYIAAYLREHRYDVDIADLSGYSYEEYPEHLDEADIFGITATVIDRQASEHVAKTIEKKYPNAKVVLGGPLTLSSDLLLDLPIDSFVFGEGEEIFLKIIKDFPNLKRTYHAKRIEDLDSLPFPARDLLEFKGGNIFAYNKNYYEGGSTVILSSRGCYFGCAFCASPGIWGRNVSFRSPENVAAEIESVIKDYNIRQFRFSDDMFTVNSKRVYEMCEIFKKFDIVWRCSIRTRPNSLELFTRMYEAGCREVSFGVESGDQDILDLMQKKTTVEDNQTAIINAKKAGLTVRVLFMIGTPGETQKTVDRNIAFFESVKDSYDTAALTTFIPIPGSAISKFPQNFNCSITDTNIDHYNFYLWNPAGVNEWRNLIKLNDLTEEQLEENKNRMKDYILSSGKSNKG